MFWIKLYCTNNLNSFTVSSLSKKYGQYRSCLFVNEINVNTDVADTATTLSFLSAEFIE